MRLEEALAVNRGDIVSFVGAGGKTTAMYRLAHELVALDTACPYRIPVGKPPFLIGIEASAG